MSRIVLLALLVPVAGCGTASSELLFGSGAGGAAPASSTSSASGAMANSSAVGSGGGNGTASSSTGASSTGSSSSGASSTNSGSSGAPSTGSSSGVSSSAATSSSSSGAPQPTVFCNNQACAPGQVCCYSNQQPIDHCGDPGACGPGYVELACNGQDDCPGQTCCATFDMMQGNNWVLNGIACQSSCDPNQGEAPLCSAAAPACPDGASCQSAAQYLGAGYAICL